MTDRVNNQQRSRSDEVCCTSVMRDCSDPDGPTVSSDCGIYDPVVHAWASGPVGDRAPWGTSPAETVLDCGPCDDVSAQCRECIERD